MQARNDQPVKYVCLLLTAQKNVCLLLTATDRDAQTIKNQQKQYPLMIKEWIIHHF